MSNFHGITLEVVCFSAEAAIAAQAGGADRIELCAASSEGGITPSFATIEYCISNLEIPVYVMIRPRGGDFLYSEAELSLMRRDIEICKQLGADGVVFGILEKDGSVNAVQCKELVELAAPMSCTFHRAFDMTKNKREALEQLIACGFDRVLTSGGQKKAVEGKELLRELNAAASGRIVILPGGGVNADCIAELARDTRLPEYHISARKFTPGEMEFRYAEMQISSDVQDDYRRLTVDPQEVERIRSIAEEIFYA